MSIFATILRQSATYSAAVIIGRLSSVLLVPVYTRFLTPSDYGVLELLSVVQVVLELLVGVRVSESLLYFYAKVRGEDEAARNKVVSSALFGSLVMGAILLAVGWAAAPLVSQWLIPGKDTTWWIRLSMLASAAVFPLSMGFSYLRALDWPIAYTVVSLIRLLLTIALAITLLAGFHMGIDGVLWAAAGGSLLPGLGLGVFMIWRVGLSWNREMFTAQLRYAAPLCVSGLLMSILHYGNRFFLQRYVSLAELGLFGLASRIALLVSFAQMPYSLYWNAQMFHIVKGKDGDSVYVRLTTYLVTVLAGVAIALSVFAPLALRILATPEFAAAAVFVPLLSATYVVRGLGDQWRSVFNIHRQTDRHMWATLAGVIASLLLFPLLIPPFGSWGAALSSLGGFAAMAWASLVWAQRLKHYHFEWLRLGKLLAACVITVSGNAWFTPVTIAGQIAWGSLWLATWVVLLLLLRFFTTAELDWARRRVQLIRRSMPVFGGG